jgi:hypothetical protein
MAIESDPTTQAITFTSSGGGGGGGIVNSVAGGTGIGVDSADPAAPIVSVLLNANGGLLVDENNEILINAGIGLAVNFNRLENTGVFSLNNLTAAINLISSDSSITITPDSGAGTINLQNAGVMSISTTGANPVVGALNMTSGSGSGITLTSGLLDAQSITVSTNLDAGTGISITNGVGTQKIISSVFPPNGLITLDSLLWTLDTTTSQFYKATATGLGATLTPDTPITATIQILSLYTSAEIVDCAGWALITAFPDSTDGGSITFFIKTNGDLNPSGNARAVNIAISYVVSGVPVG